MPEKIKFCVSMEVFPIELIREHIVDSVKTLHADSVCEKDAAILEAAARIIRTKIFRRHKTGALM